MRFLHLYRLLLLVLAFSFRRFAAQQGSLAPKYPQGRPGTDQGFISLDCGLQDPSSSYVDLMTGLPYSPDDGYVDDGKGEGKSISLEFRSDYLPRQYNYVRSFPGPLGTRGCYTLKLHYRREYQILLRVGFMYGNYEGNNVPPPQFDLYLGANLWETVSFDNSSSFFNSEIQLAPTSDSLHLCVVNTGQGTPFTSLIELRPTVLLNVSPYNTLFGPLKFFSRWDLGSSSPILRYKDDSFDRTWEPTPDNLTYATNITTDQTSNINAGTGFAISPKILSTAIEAPGQNDSLVIDFDTDDSVFMYFHFAEIAVLNGTREVNIYLNGAHWYGPLTLPYLSILTVYLPTEADPPGRYIFSINATANSSAPAMLNAFEAYTVKQFPLSETNEMDVAAIKGMKATYNVTKNWQGDPCFPMNLTWTGIDCSYNNSEPPSIISLNLSSSKLVGNISLSISNLTNLQSLDLSFNNLTGAVPDFLAWLPNLKYLYLTGNNINASLPPALKEKSRNGSLRIYFESPENPTHCEDGDPCNKKTNTTVIVACAVVGSIVGIVAVSTLIYVIIKKKRKAVQKVNLVPSKVTSFPFYEVMNVIGHQKIIGRGGFGTVYYGCMSGIEVAVKVFNSSQEIRNKDFQSEVKILGTVYHKNLTRIIGYCEEGSNKAIILEFMENGNLQDHLSETSPNVLSWINRLRILTGAGEGLEYLHHGCKPPIIHRDIKPENVLLTKDFEAKLADFGFSRNFPCQSSTVVGTYGYHDPLYVDPSMMTEKVDVYSFGVLMLSVVTGKPAIIQGTHLSQWISHYIQNGDIRHIVDARLKEDYNLNVAWRVVELAMACVSTEASSRPNMHYVVKELKEYMPIPHEQYEHDEWRSPNDERVLSSVMSREIAPSIRYPVGAAKGESNKSKAKKGF